MDLLYQKKMAASILKCGLHRVHFDPARLEDISEAVTRADIKILINSGAIMPKQKKGISTGRKHYLQGQKAKGKRKGHGSRKGTKFARFPRKDRWISIIRPIRKKLAELRKEGVLSRSAYREAYLHAKGGIFKNTQHMLEHLKNKGLLKGTKVKAVKKVVKVAKPAVKKAISKTDDKKEPSMQAEPAGEVKKVVKKVRKPKEAKPSSAVTQKTTITTKGNTAAGTGNTTKKEAR
ncbi:MAG: 50S ribosomal protein L19e [Thermoplasmata archaeon]